MSIKKIIAVVSVFIAMVAQAQQKNKEILFTIDDKPYYTDEFSRVYNKNIDLVKDESQKDLNNYLNLFIGYKLKVNKAYKLGLQDSESYKSELKNYRNQLAKSYTTDKKVTEELIQEGYSRLQKEINASHILITCEENATAEDTLAAYHKAMTVKKRLDSGEDFATVAKEVSQDPSAKENGGNLGYFSAFRMVYPFETAAYKTPLGKVSNPVRTRFGYHIVKVNDVRPNRGEIQVAHIMTMKAKEGEDQEKPKKLIDEVYAKLQNGEKFEDLAKQYSEDKSSGPKGGVLNRFASGQLSSEIFENKAFGLTKDSPVSEPFQSEFGWHIVKLIEKYPLKTLEESRAELDNKIGKDDRSIRISNSLTDKLVKKYPIKVQKQEFKKVSDAITNAFFDKKWELPTNKSQYETTLFAIENKNIKGIDFLEFVKKQQYQNYAKQDIAKLSNQLLDKFKKEQINLYYNDNLENEFPEFAHTMQEYREGLLLFDLMEKELWQKAKTDTLGLKKFYADMPEKPMWKPRAKAILVASTSEKTAKEAFKMLKQNKTIQQIKDKFNTKENAAVQITEGVYENTDAALPKGLPFTTGFHDLVKQGDFYTGTQILSILPASVKTLDECKSKVINDYQQYLEQHWVDELKKEFVVKVNPNVFDTVKAALKK